MKILVLIRSASHGPDEPAPAEALDPGERQTLATALKLKKEIPDTTLGVLAAGPESLDPALAAAHAAGADHTYRLWDPLFSEVDAMGLAEALAFAAQKIGFELILAPMRPTHALQGFLGPALAECLELPHLTGASFLALEPDQHRLRVQRPLGHQLWEHTITLPCLVTVTGSSELEITDATDHSPEVLGLEDIQLSEAIIRPRARLRGTYQQSEPPKPRPETIWVEDGAAAIARLRRLDYVGR